MSKFEAKIESKKRLNLPIPQLGKVGMGLG